MPIQCSIQYSMCVFASYISTYSATYSNQFEVFVGRELNEHDDDDDDDDNGLTLSIGN